MRSASAFSMPRERRKKSIWSSIRPQVAPWPQTTSSAKISSSGLLANSALSERSSARLIILESVFCAPGSTMILPWKTPCDWPSIAALKYSWPPQRGAAWLTTSVVSRCCLPRPIVAPRSPTCEPSPSNAMRISLRATSPPAANANGSKRTSPASRGRSSARWIAWSPSSCAVTQRTSAPSPIWSSVTTLVW